MFDFDEVDRGKIKQLEKEKRQLENQVKHWKSLYERETRKRVTKVQYVTNEQYFDKYYLRTKELLKIMLLTDNIEYWQMLVEDLMDLYDIREYKKWDIMHYMMRMIDH